MGILRPAKSKKDSPDSPRAARSIYVSNVRIDKAGKQWKKQPVWIRQEYLSKLKMIGHFEDKTTQELMDQALSEFISKKWDNTMAMKKMVGTP